MKLFKDHRSLRKFIKDKTAIIGILILISIVLMSIFAPVISPRTPTEQSLIDRLTPPGGDFILGTDNFGRDQLSRIIHGSRISLIVGISSVAIGMLIGVPLGILGGFLGGWVDVLIDRFTDISMSFPNLILALLIVSLLGPGADKLIVAIGFTFIPRFTRIARASALSIKENEYIEAAEALGASKLYIMIKYVLPNISGELLAISALFVGVAIRSEATLSFLGLGVQPPTPSWGRMLQDGLVFIHRAPWLVIYPSVAIFITILAINMFGDGFRDALDPKLNDSD